MKKCFLTLMSLLFVSGLITACSENGPDNNGDNTDIEEIVPEQIIRFSSPIFPSRFLTVLMP